MKKVLILYATAGIGHKKAALAVKKAFDELSIDNTEVKCEDALDYTNRFYKWFYLKVYLFMISRMPYAWGFFYYLTDNRFVNIAIAVARRAGNWLNSGKLVRYIIDTAPDIVISTHFFASEVISDMKTRGQTAAGLITVITDYKLHSWWLSRRCDIYVAGSDYVVEGLLSAGIPEMRVKLLGLPVEPVFSKPVDRARVIRDAGLDEGAFTVLVIGGGFGVGPIEEIIQSINCVTKPIQVIAICGHNKPLTESLERSKPSLRHKIKILGFVDNVYEYMEVSDVLISKSGGITVAESMSKELPMIIISPIPGQETRNSSFLVGHNAAMKIGGVDGLKPLLESILSDPGKLGRLRLAIKEIRRPMACYDIARLSVGIIEEKR